MRECCSTGSRRRVRSNAVPPRKCILCDTVRNGAVSYHVEVYISCCARAVSYHIEICMRFCARAVAYDIEICMRCCARAVAYHIPGRNMYEM